MRTPLLLFIFLVCNLLQPFTFGQKICIGSKLMRVSVANKVSDPIVVHCASGDTDYGNRTIGVDHDFHWKFCTNIFGKTLFFCHLWWSSNHVGASFVVYNSSVEKTYCYGGFCYWIAKRDGIYNFDNKVYDWNTSITRDLGLV